MVSEIRTLLDVLDSADGQSMALILPETGLSVTYDDLRRRVRGMASALLAAGIYYRRDRGGVGLA